MAGRIRVLTDDIVNKIAAGEVIENSASVVKELVENSLDAGATEIHVEIKGGGRQLIRVTDNGCGMNHDDALLCLERHATSKLRKVDDLETIGTLGFRGEAIPSIASISKFTLVTCPQEDPTNAGATMVIVDGGNILKACSAERNPGTTLEVKNLFFNVPARRKFQRAPAHDTTEVLKTLSNLALAFPQVGFELIADQQTLLKARAAELSERIDAVLGPDYIEQCCPVDHTHGACRLEGFVGLPSYSRPNRAGQHLLINQRAVISPLIAHLVREAYGTALPTNRYPLFVLHLTVPGGLVDVNVHPQKREVRLRQNELLRELLLQGIGKALQKSHLPVHSAAPSPALMLRPLKPLPEPGPLPWEDPPPNPQFVEIAIPMREEPPAPAQSALLEPAKEGNKPPKVLAAVCGYVVLDPQSCPHLMGSASLVLLDQRAAHQRILFERMRHKGRADIQPLLIPATLDFSALEASCIREVLPQLRAMGFEVDEFGQNTFLIRAVPAEFETSDAASLLCELVEQLREYQSEGLRAQEREKRLALAASRLAVHRKHQLSISEAQHLVDQLFACESPLHCPQGRPILVGISERELAKHFSMQREAP